MNKVKFKSTSLIIALSMTVLFSCTDELPVINRFENVDHIPTITGQNVEMTYTEKGYKKGTLQADVFENYDMNNDALIKFPKGIKITMFNKAHEVETEMEADSAIYFPDKRTWEAIGHVIVKNINGTILRTEKLYGDETKKKIFTNLLVNITKTDGTLVVGKTGFISNTEFTIYKFINMYGRFFISETEGDSIQTPNKKINTDNTPNYSPKKLPQNMKKPEYIKGEK